MRATSQPDLRIWDSGPLRCWDSQCDRLPDGLIAQLAEHCTGIAEVMGSSLKFFLDFMLISQPLSCVYNCDDHVFMSYTYKEKYNIFTCPLAPSWRIGPQKYNIFIH